MKSTSCREVSRLASQALDRTLSPEEQAAFQLHLAICAGCRTVNEQLVFLRRAIRRLADPLDKG